MKAISKQDRECVRKIIHRFDWARIEEVGGYESEWTIENGKVYWASLQASKEYRAAELVVMPVAAFIKKYRDFLDEDGSKASMEAESYGDSRS